MPNDEYMDNLSNLNNKKIEILQFPRGGDLGISEGEIIKIDKNEITHKAGTEEGSSGSPLFLKDEMGVIGIHKQEKSDKLENYANMLSAHKIVINGSGHFGPKSGITEIKQICSTHYMQKNHFLH